MHDDLVKRLRDAAKMSEALAVLLPHSEGSAVAKLHRDAADAIEELGEYVNTIRRLKREGWYLQQTKFHYGYHAVGTMPLPEPPKEE